MLYHKMIKKNKKTCRMLKIDFREKGASANCFRLLTSNAKFS